MSTNYFDFLDQNSGSTPATSEGVTMKDEFVNLTLRADAECQVTCDGDFLVLLSPNQITKEKAPVGQHILQFISTTHPDIQIEKIVDFPDPGKNYLVLVNEFAGLMKDMASKEQEEEIRRKQEQALREAELAKVEAERIRAEAEKAKMIEALEAERKREEELARRELEAKEQAKRKREELNSIDFIEKYTIRDYDESIQVRKEYDVVSINQALDAEIKPAIEFGNPDAEYVYYLILSRGIGCVPDCQSGFKYLISSANKGCAAAQYSMGFKYYNGDSSVGVWKDYKEAVKWFVKSSAQGYGPALIYLGHCYADGYGVDKNQSEAVKCVMKALELGYAPAGVHLWDRYRLGIGVERDMVEAEKWCRISANMGYADAQYRLGEFYLNDRFEIDLEREEKHKEAVKWLKLAVEQEHKWAQCSLAYCYSEGVGVEQDYNEALRLYRLSAEQGCKPAKIKIEELSNK